MYLCPQSRRLRLTIVSSLLPKTYQRLILPLLLSCFLWLLLTQALYHHSSSSSSSSRHDDNTRQGHNERLVQRAFRKLAGVLNSTTPVLSIKISVFEDNAMTSKDVIVHTNDVGNDADVVLNDVALKTTKSTVEHEPQRHTSTVTLRPFETVADMSAFKPVLRPDEKRVLLELADKLTELTEQLNITCFMYGGSLLGSYRHHDLIPWDDDIDVIVKFRYKDRLYSALSRLASSYGVYWAGPRLKFYSVYSTKTSKYPWKWPYVDIHFYKENETHIWDSAKEFSRYVYNKSCTFPLHRRPLGDTFMNAPRDTYATLKATYRNTTTMCETHYYSHKFETNRELKRYRVPCETLNYRLAFVHRTRTEGGVKETLIKGDTVIHSLVIDEPEYAISKPYSLELL